MLNPYQIILEILDDAIRSERTKDVIVRRFGLINGQRQTLEEIGQNYAITRERVRQIEEVGLKSLSNTKYVSHLKPTFDFVHSHLLEHGELRREKTLMDDLVYICMPAVLKEAADAPRQIRTAQKEFDPIQCQAALYLILALGDPFIREKETKKFHPLWTINRKSIALAKKIIDFFAKYFNKATQTLEFKDLYYQLKEIDERLTEKALASYLDASKEIAVNRFGHYGLSHWPEISPRGVRDKAYLVMKQHGQPLHFVEITKLINKSSLDHKKAQVETVHNELIKDSRFILIGRGIYALAEWGYESGTVPEVITILLKEHGPLSKEEILKKVLEKRIIKENTVLINLQNRKIFTRDEEGRYTLKNF